jgi:putative oxidoreductase
MRRLVADRREGEASGLAEWLLRWALGLVYVWFGALKLVGMSPVLELIRLSMPPLASLPLYLGLALFELAVGVALLGGWWTRRAAAAVVLHLAGTFGVLVASPQLAFLPAFPFLTMEGEFIVKNLVLMAGALVLWLHARAVAPAPRLLHAWVAAPFGLLAAGMGLAGAQLHQAQRAHAQEESATAPLDALPLSTGAVAALAGERQPVVVSGEVVERCPVMGCWLRLKDATGTLWVDLAAAGLNARGIPLGARVGVTGYIGKTREGTVGFVASRLEPLASQVER